MLGLAMLTSPSQKVYNLFESVWKMYWADMAMNWHPQSAGFSGPSGRHYDLTTGTRHTNTQRGSAQHATHTSADSDHTLLVCHAFF